MGATVSTETGAFHNPVGNLQFEKHLGSLGLPAGPPLSHIGRPCPFRELRNPCGCSEVSTCERAERASHQAVPEGIGWRVVRNSAAARQHAQTRDFVANGCACFIHVGGGGESPEMQ